MKTITITEAFTGYPSGKLREFAKGEEADVPDAFADVITSKGLAKEKPAEPAAPATRPEKKEAKS